MNTTDNIQQPLISPGKVYLIPSSLYENVHTTIPPYVLDAIKDCRAFFAEDERTTRRYFKSLWKEMNIDDYQWATIHKAEAKVKKQFLDILAKGKNIGIVSEAGCPGIADPGQLLVAAAQHAGYIVRPLVGPSAILLALMGSGLNGQQFEFLGYLPIENMERIKTIKQIESASARKNSTQIFIETPYRNNQLLEMLLKTCQPPTWLCIAADLTSESEFIQTKTIAEWKKQAPDLHKRPVIFCLLNDRSA